MIELQLNHGHNEIVTPMTENETDERLSLKLTEIANEWDESKRSIFVMAQAITNRGHQHRRLCRSSSII